MTRLEMIRALGDAIAAVDELRSRFPPGTPTRDACDVLRERLDRDQRRLSLRVLDEGTPVFRGGAARVEQLNGELRAAIDDTTGTAKALQTLADLAAVVQEIAELV